MYVYFSMYEEVGQKGAINLPLELLKEASPQYVIVVDRMSSRHPHGTFRHAVIEYCHVPLTPPGPFPSILSVLGGAQDPRERPDDGDRLQILACPSPYCSDAVEIRGRWDAEVVLPRVLALLQNTDPHTLGLRRAKDAKALIKEGTKLEAKYTKATQAMRALIARAPKSDRVCSYSARPRSSRYKVMAKITLFLYAIHPLLDTSSTFTLLLTHDDDASSSNQHLHLQAVNLSLDYDEKARSFPLSELDATIALLARSVLLPPATASLFATPAPSSVV